MPQLNHLPPRIRNQRGSVLAGIIGLGLVMTTAAASYLLMAGNTSGINSDRVADERIFQTAESGLNLGLRWAREMSPGNLTNRSWIVVNTPLIKTPSGSEWIDFNGARLRVRLDPGVFPGTPYQTIRSFATLGAGKDTLILSVEITGANAHTGGGSVASDLVLGGWKRQLIPGRG